MFQQGSHQWHNYLYPTAKVMFSSLLTFSFDQAALWMVQSVRLSVCPSVCMSHLFQYVPVLISSWNFQELLQWQKWGPCKRSRSEIKGQAHRGQSILNSHMMVKWCTNLMLLRRGALLFSRLFIKFQGNTTKKSSIWPQFCDSAFGL